MVACSSFSALDSYISKVKFGENQADTLLNPNWGIHLCLIKP